MKLHIEGKFAEETKNRSEKKTPRKMENVNKQQ